MRGSPQYPWDKFKFSIRLVASKPLHQSNESAEQPAGSLSTLYRGKYGEFAEVMVTPAAQKKGSKMRECMVVCNVAQRETCDKNFYL